MKIKINISAVFTLILALAFGFGKVTCDESENSTMSEPLGVSHRDDQSSSTPESLKMEAKDQELMATTLTSTTTEVTSTTYIIPPTLLNTKIEFNNEKQDKQENSEKHEKSLKDLG